jgi:hypothetical protein
MESPALKVDDACLRHCAPIMPSSPHRPRSFENSPKPRGNINQQIDAANDRDSTKNRRNRSRHHQISGEWGILRRLPCTARSQRARAKPRLNQDYLTTCGDRPRAVQTRQIKVIFNNRQAGPRHSEPFTFTAQFAVNGQDGIEFLLQIIAALLAFLQIEFKATFFFKVMTLSQRLLVFQFIYPLDIGLRTRCCRWRLKTFDRRRWR